MLTPNETNNTRNELQENYRRLGESEDAVLNDLHAVSNMTNPYPGNVWMVSDYLEDKLKEKEIAIMPFSCIASNSANQWYSYETPWKK